jgi:hypothetical protein
VNPSKKAGLVGIVFGSVSILAGLMALTLPMIYAKKATAARLHDFVAGRAVHHSHNAFSNPTIAWIVGAPIGVVALGFGALVLVLSLVIYFDAKRKETAKV